MDMRVTKIGTAGAAASPGAKRESAAAGGVKAVSARMDRLEISRQALSALQAQQEAQTERLRSILEKREEKDPLLAQLDQLDGDEEESGQLDAMKDAIDALMKCMKIASRIMDGDNVPPKDQQYLMENQPDLYKMAVAMRRPKEDPKDWDSLLEDEEGSQESGEAVPAGGGGWSGLGGEDIVPAVVENTGDM